MRSQKDIAIFTSEDNSIFQKRYKISTFRKHVMKKNGNGNLEPRVFEVHSSDTLEGFTDT
jgi:hypothetical protein